MLVDMIRTVYTSLPNPVGALLTELLGHIAHLQLKYTLDIPR